MSDDNQFVLERLRLWRQIETLLNELQDRLYDWYDTQPEIDDIYKRLGISSKQNGQKNCFATWPMINCRNDEFRNWYNQESTSRDSQIP
jgi:hypothetical protein